MINLSFRLIFRKFSFFISVRYTNSFRYGSLSYFYILKTTAYICVCDNGEGLNSQELKDLWRIGESSKRKGSGRDKRRLQIGQFGIGKLATYILARKLTYISKKEERYILATMDYNLIKEEYKSLLIDEREVNENEAKSLLELYVDENIVKFSLFGKNAEKSWTVSLMTELKPKANEIKIGRLKWVLKTALPLNPGFELNFNGEKMESSKINVPIMKKWIIGKDDETAENIPSSASSKFISRPRIIKNIPWLLPSSADFPSTKESSYNINSP